MAVEFTFKEKYSFEDLIEIIRILRAPGGCPWDREQTHQSIRENFLEETYEVLEAIDKLDPVLMQEELGDVLLQIVLHADMAKEESWFTIDEVCNDICQKLIIRHPHVFGDVNVSSTDDVLINWDNIKRQTKSQKTQSDAMASIPATYPALMKAQKVQSKAKKAGFDWDDAEGAFLKVEEEATELKVALESGVQADIEDELGDLLFSAVNVARFCNCDAETALEKATQKFMKRFSITERLASEKGIDMKKASLEVLDSLWNEAKKQ
ncbi:MAG: nucleoside triphosphate pyrophosphohydrolase [Clostridia bacterium]|jgi:tetrapyrrole methylase family protein/MazG family protein|nr:nucleoside triphosphate pyrophosphohydrolase [Clostridia bacterium]